MAIPAPKKSARRPKATRFESLLPQAISIKPAYSEAHFNLALTYHGLGCNHEAVEAFKQTIRLEPDHVKAHYNLGVAYLSLGEVSSALQEYKILKDLDREAADELFSRIYK